MFGCRSAETATLRSVTSDRRRLSSASPDKEERYYTTRGSVMGADENGKISGDGNGNRNQSNCNGDERDKGFVWPKLYTTLSSKEKEEDFMAMKGCKLPQRPKKRAKIIQRSLLVSLFPFSCNCFLNLLSLFNTGS